MKHHNELFANLPDKEAITTSSPSMEMTNESENRQRLKECISNNFNVNIR